MWCPTELEVNGKEMHFPLPETDLPLNYIHSAGLRYEAEEVRCCLLKGTNERRCKTAHLLLHKFSNILINVQLHHPC